MTRIVFVTKATVFDDVEVDWDSINKGRVSRTCQASVSEGRFAVHHVFIVPAYVFGEDEFS